VAYGWASPAYGALIAYEPFDYPNNTKLLGQTNGIGFLGAWEPGGFNATVVDVFQIKPGALSYPGLLTQGSNHLGVAEVPPQILGIAGLIRVFPTNLAVAGKTYYLSFLIRPDGTNEFTSIVIGTGDSKELSVGKSARAPRYHISQRGGTGRVFAEVPPRLGNTDFLVVKMEFRSGPDRFTLYVNPTPGKPEPAEGAVKEDLDLEDAEILTLYSRGAWSVDEIRVGTEWEDVTPVAKP
jgi:hypothetical protein